MHRGRDFSADFELAKFDSPESGAHFVKRYSAEMRTLEQNVFESFKSGQSTDRFSERTNKSHFTWAIFDLLTNQKRKTAAEMSAERCTINEISILKV